MSLLSFLLASAALTIAPGPDNIFILSQGVSRGRRHAIVSALGMCSGISIHTAAAALGISALLYASPFAFDAIKFTGAAYLLSLAFTTLKQRSATGLGSAVDLPDAALFRRGFLMNVLNPKVALFFFAFLPQFVTGGPLSLPIQMIFLGLLFMGQAVIIFTLIGWFSGAIGDIITRRPGIARNFDWLTASVFISLALHLVLTHP